MENSTRIYQFFGWRLGTAENLDHLLRRTSESAQFHYAVRREPLPDEAGKPVYESPIPDAEGNPRLLIWRTSAAIRAVFSSAGAFIISPDQIVSHPRPDVAPEVVENALLGAVAAFWLEYRGVPALHASAVEIDGGAVAFASHSGGGKSSLAALFLKHGRALLSDDVLAVGVSGDRAMGRPAFPLMRMWPQEARFFLGRVRGLQRVHPESLKRRVRLPFGPFGGFCSRPLPLTRIYFPVWRGDSGQDVVLTPISPLDGVIQLLKYSFAGRVAAALGLQPYRLDLFSELARRVPMRRLLYPKGFARLKKVRDAVYADLEAG